MKRDDGDGHHAEPYHGEGVLATQEAGVKVADAGDHDPDEGGGGKDPSDVTEIVDAALASVGVEPL